MNERNQELRDAFGELAAERPDRWFHPDPGELAAYHEGELSLERERQIQDHLAACRECAGLLLDLDGLADPSFGAASGLASKSEKEAVWRRLRDDIHPPAPVVPIRRPALSSPRWLQALAAALLVATLGLSLWVASLQRMLEPQANARYSLDSSTTRGEVNAARVTVIPAGKRMFTLILSPGTQRRDRYRVRIERSGGEEVCCREEYEPDRLGILSLNLSRITMPAGNYRVHLLGPRGEPLKEYEVRVEGP